LPALERLAAIPDLAALRTHIESRTKAGDVVLELHGRGGWVTRAAIDALRRSFVIAHDMRRCAAIPMPLPPSARRSEGSWWAAGRSSRR
jgi:hypothetical protein